MCECLGGDGKVVTVPWREGEPRVADIVRGTDGRKHSHNVRGRIMSFDGRVAFVAGAGGGMGLNIANDLILEGAHVVLADIKERPAGIRDGPG